MNNSTTKTVFFVFFLLLQAVNSFAPSSSLPKRSMANSITKQDVRELSPFGPNVNSARLQSSAIQMSTFDVVKDPIQSYVNIWTPMFHTAMDSGLVPDFLLHWGHGAAMSSVLLSMGLIGAWMGWQIRFGNGDEVNSLTLGDKIREAHPKIIGGAFFFFLLGGQGGLVLLDTQGGSILESPHAITAIISVAMLATQAVLPKLFATENGALARDAHAYLGSATMVALFAHLATGIKLGLSF